MVIAALAASGDRVIVVPYQTLNVDQVSVERVAVALRAAVGAKGFEVPETSRQQRAAVMCGEELECLATLGTRSDSKWVVAWGLARIGGATLVNALLVETRTGARMGAFSEKLPALPDDVADLATRVVAALLRDVPPPQVPLDTVVAPVVEVPRRPLRTAAIAVTGATAVATVATVVLGLSAHAHFRQLPDVPVEQRGPAVAHQRALNTGADVALGVAIAAGVSAVVLFVVDARAGEHP
ncbi:MAG: hypothetical protein JNG84_01165 [Archangium sp.]|nr:hypothetical protein [Archangium sp.]